MIFLNPIVILEKIDRNETLSRNIKSFIASLMIYALLLATVLYFSANNPILLPKSDGKIAISLAKFASLAGNTAHTEQPHSQAKTSEPIIKPQPQPQVHHKTLQPTSSTTLEKMPLQSTVASSEGPAPLAPSHAASLISSSPLIDSPHLNVSSKTGSELSKTPDSDNEIGGAALGRIRAMIENAITYPAIARKLRLEGVVLVFFVLNPDGTVETVKVKSTSGSDILDTKAIQTILSLSGHYPALGKTFELSIPIAFSLKNHKEHP